MQEIPKCKSRPALRATQSRRRFALPAQSKVAGMVILLPLDCGRSSY